MKTWEYRVICVMGGDHFNHEASKMVLQELESLGAEGWELAGVGVQSYYHVLYFKRERT